MFPKKADMRTKWVAVIGFTLVELSWKRSPVICKRHFLTNDYKALGKTFFRVSKIAQFEFIKS